MTISEIDWKITVAYRKLASHQLSHRDGILCTQTQTIDSALLWFMYVAFIICWLQKLMSDCTVRINCLSIYWSRDENTTLVCDCVPSFRCIAAWDPNHQHEKRRQFQKGPLERNYVTKTCSHGLFPAMSIFIYSFCLLNKTSKKSPLSHLFIFIKKLPALKQIFVNPSTAGYECCDLVLSYSHFHWQHSA